LILTPVLNIVYFRLNILGFVDDVGILIFCNQEKDRLLGGVLGGVLGGGGSGRSGRSGRSDFQVWMVSQSKLGQGDFGVNEQRIKNMVIEVDRLAQGELSSGACRVTQAAPVAGGGAGGGAKREEMGVGKRTRMRTGRNLLSFSNAVHHTTPDTTTTTAATSFASTRTHQEEQQDAVVVGAQVLVRFFFFLFYTFDLWHFFFQYRLFWFKYFILSDIIYTFH
jgi:hypothetical protein